MDQSERKIKEEEKRLEKDTQLRIAEAETVLDRRVNGQSLYITVPVYLVI